MLWIAGACVSVFMTSRAYAAPLEEKLQKQIAEAFEKGNVYAVVQDGSGDFTTIQDGVNAVKSGDTLLIYPGIYEENVEIYNKTVNLLGIDKDSCILQYESIEYNAIPLTFGAGYIANLTIYGYDDGEIEEKQDTISTFYDNSSLESIREWQKNFSGYALHIDQNYTYGREAYVENCRIVSNNNQSIGIGCRGESRITFEACELISNGTGGCIYFHNTDNENLGGEAYFIMKDCELKNYISPYVISIHSMGAVNPVFVTFQKVRTSTIVYDEKGAYNVTNMNAGFDVDEMIVLNTVNLLQPSGYYSSINHDLITYFDIEQSSQYVSSLEEGISPSKKEVALSEGITYLCTKNVDDKWIKKEATCEVQTRKRHVIDIFNNSQLVGDGWCGLDHIYLTPDSYGNTLIEMNYPIVYE